jgi:hypothetical protein
MASSARSNPQTGDEVHDGRVEFSEKHVKRRRVGLTGAFRSASRASDATPGQSSDAAMFSTIFVGLWWFLVGVPESDCDVTDADS